MKNYKKEKIDQDLEHIKDILRNIPEQQIPEQFDRRFKQALKAEVMNANSNKRKYKKWLRVTATFAACLIVGIISISMYNDHIGLDSINSTPEENEELLQNDAGGEVFIASGEGTDKQNKDYNKELIKSAESENSGRLNKDNAIGEDRVRKEAREPEDSVLEMAQIMGDDELAPSSRGTKTEESDRREYSGLVTLNEEFIYYASLVNRYLDKMEFELVSYTKDIETGRHLFHIIITKDEEGNEVNEPVVLIGTKGEIHEQSTDQQSYSCD